MNIQKFVNTPQDASFHSNGFADAASKSSGLGAAPQSFSERARINTGRVAVRGYGDSMIARGHMRDASRSTLGNRNPSGPVGPRGQMNVGGGIRPAIVPPRSFSEPPGRNFTPFS